MIVREARTRVVAVSGCVAAVILLGISQLVLPAIAANRVKSDLSTHASGVNVSVHAFPAIELLFGHASSIDVTGTSLRSTDIGTGHMLDQIRKVGTVNAHFDRVDFHGLQLTDLNFHKRGSELAAQAHVTTAAIKRVLPVSVSLSDQNGGPSALQVRVSADVFGKHVSVAGQLAVRDGDIVLRPVFGGLAGLLDSLHIAVFHSPAVAVTGIRERWTGTGYRLFASGHYR